MSYIQAINNTHRLAGLLLKLTKVNFFTEYIIIQMQHYFEQALYYPYFAEFMTTTYPRAYFTEFMTTTLVYDHYMLLTPILLSILGGGGAGNGAAYTPVAV